MNKYAKYLPELKTTTLFQDIEDNQLLALLEVMQPKIIMRKAGEPMPPMPPGTFKMALRSTPARQLLPRQFKYDMPAFGEPGMLMAEIPTYSRMGDSLPQKPKGPIHKMTPLDYDLEMLEFTEYMMTDFYGEEYAKAQSTMLRNFLGILAQKVCDVRHELFLIRDGRDMFCQTEKTLQIFTAGVAASVVKETVQKWNLTHEHLKAEMHMGGSVDLIRKVLSGERCDVLITADDSLISTMLMPKGEAKGYLSFAGNKIVVSARGGREISDDNWKEKLLDTKAKFAHKNPYADPGGYRGVMALLLADEYEEGLGKKLMGHPGHIGMDPGLTIATMPAHDYDFEYYSSASSRGATFANLPEVMDLSNPALADIYAKVSFDVDPANNVIARPISHGITLLEHAKFKEEAKEFIKLFLKRDFTEYHFLERKEIVGEDILK